MEEKVGGNRKRPIVTLRSHVVALTAAASFMLALTAGYAAGGSGPAGPSTAVWFEDIPGTDLKRVFLTERAAERLGIETAEVYETRIIRTQIVGGRVVPPLADQPMEKASAGAFSGFAQPVAATTQLAVQGIEAQATLPELLRAWVLVTLSPDEWERTRHDMPARIIRLQTRSGDELLATPSKVPVREDPKRTMLTAYYEIPGDDHGLLLNERVRVELQLSDSDQMRKVVPYAAVYYDGNGVAWVYANPAPLVYERMLIEIERIEGNLAVLRAGPPLGTSVVIVGAPLLYGAEVIYKR